MNTTNTLKTLALAAVATVVTATAMTAPAHASRNTCKKVYLSATNNTGGTVKIIDLDYNIRGYGKKSEPIRNQEIPNGRPWATERNLEQASGRSVSVIFKYRTRKRGGLGKWSGVKRASTGYKRCNDRTAYTVSLR